jgi:hypothetical protein
MSEETEKSLYSQYDIFLTADAYFESAKILRRSLSPVDMNNLEDFQYVLVANHSFALELFLKCLLVMDRQKVPHHHRLDDLFKGLLPSTRDMIRNCYMDILEKDPAKAEYARLRGVGEDPEKTFALDNALAASSRAFEYSRYPYDPSYRTHAYFGDWIAEAVRKVVIDRRPAWDGAVWRLLARRSIPPTSQAH